MSNQQPDDFGERNEALFGSLAMFAILGLIILAFACSAAVILALVFLLLQGSLR